MDKKNRPDQSQRERFEETARQIGADEADDALDRAMDRLDLRAKPKGAAKPKPDPKVPR